MARVVGGAALFGLVITVVNAAASYHWDIDELEDQKLPTKRFLSCKNQNENCYGFPSCCGDLTCYWKDGYSPFRPGTCVMCIEEGLACQKDSGCCGGLICDKLDLLTINGVCKPPRTSGSCYREVQCLHKCIKAWYKGQGRCTSAP